MNWLKKIFISTKTVRLFVIAIAMVVAGIIAYGVIVLNIRKNISEADGLGINIAAESQKEANIESTRNILRGTTAEREKIESYFVRSDNIVDFLEKIELLGKKSGVSLSFDSVDIPPEEKNVLRVRIGTEGNWEDTFYFLSLVENLPFKIELEKSSIVKMTRIVSNIKTSYWRGDLTVKLLSFYQNK